ncbi:MAG: hypothetical protein HY905_22200 [Deltaproteobacteria bacterium]|nr:hypothetical protein [Deltaproteobacteria bacterium]
MPTWGEIQEYARSKYKLAKDEEHWFSLVFAYDNERRQLVRIKHFKAFDQDWLDFASACCKQDEMSPVVALKKNNDFAVGSICLDGDVYVFKYTVPLKNLDIEEFELPLHVVASTADQLESQFAAQDKF